MTKKGWYTNENNTMFIKKPMQLPNTSLSCFREVKALSKKVNFIIWISCGQMKKRGSCFTKSGVVGVNGITKQVYARISDRYRVKYTIGIFRTCSSMYRSC